MIEHTGHQLDAVVVLTVDAEELVQRLLQRAVKEGRADDTEEVIRRRQEVLRRPDRTAHRRLPRPRPPDRGRGDRIGRRRQNASSTPSRASRRADPRPPWAFATEVSRSRHPTRSRRCASPGCSSARRSSCCVRRCVPGVTTGELDRIADEHIRAGDGVPSFLGYGHPGPATICTSVNDEVVHGIPGDRVLAERRRDLDRLRCHRRRLARGRCHHGGGGGRAVRRTRADAGDGGASLWAGLAAARLGGRVTDISHAVEGYVHSQPHPSGAGYGILKDFTGHGIGTAMHQPPNVPNYGRPGRGPKLERGLALAVEPMVTLGSKHTGLAPTSGPWSPTTAAGRRTSSTPSPSCRTAPGSSPPWTAGRPS